jgi:hypothetical protein
MTATVHTARLTTLLTAAVAGAALGEDFGCDVRWDMAKQPAGVVLVYVLLVTLRSPVLGQSPLVHFAVFPTPDLRYEQVGQFATSAVAELRALSARMLREAVNGARSVT